MKSSNSFPNLGLGVGLRPSHYSDFFEDKNLAISWVEVISENYMSWMNFQPQKPMETLERVRENIPVVMHGVSLSIGSADALNLDYLRKLRDLEKRIQPSMISDHLCWTGVNGENLHDLMPLPYTEEAIRHIVSKVQQVQDFLGRQILLENVSSYVEFSQSEMPEWDFLKEVTNRAGCGILLDVNNVYVSSFNHHFDPKKYLEAIPVASVGQMHLAGHTNKGTHLIDTHDEPVCDEVWELYRFASARFGHVNTMVEWDAQIPTWQRLMEEVGKIKIIQDGIATITTGDACEKPRAGRTAATV